MTSNSKKDHSISFDELTGGTPLPISPEPTRLSSPSASAAPESSDDQMIDDTVSPEPITDNESAPVHHHDSQTMPTLSVSDHNTPHDQHIFAPTDTQPVPTESNGAAQFGIQTGSGSNQILEPDSTPAHEPIKLNDDLIANRTYRVEPGKLFGNMVDHTEQTKRIDQLLDEERGQDKPSAQAFTPSDEPIAKVTPIDFSQPIGFKPAIAPKIDLRPVIDEKAGFRDSVGSLAVTWWSRFVKLTHIKQLFASSRLRYIGIGLGSFLVFYLVFNYQLIVAQLGYMINQPKAVTTLTQPATSPIAANNANATSATQAEIVPPDNIIVIPKINVNAPVVLEPSLAEKNIQRSLQNGVVHYAGTALPGEPGNVAIVGHSSNDWWEPGNYKFVFALLEKVTVGDKIQVNYNSHKYVYEVINTKVVEPTDLSVLAPTAEPTLTLITCTPPGTSWKRLIVSARQIEPVPASAPTPQLAKASATTTPAPASISALPGNSPGFLSQIGDFFSKIWNFFFHKPTDSTSPATQARPAQHLPELN